MKSKSLQTTKPTPTFTNQSKRPSPMQSTAKVKASVPKERPPWDGDLTRKRVAHNTAVPRTTTRVGDDLITRSRRVLEKLKQQAYATGPTSSSSGAAGVGARLYSDGIRRLARQDRRAHEHSAVPKPEEWSCAKCGTFQSGALESINGSFRTAPKVCSNCNFNQTSVEQFKPVILAPASMDATDILQRWVGRPQDASPHYLLPRGNVDDADLQSSTRNKDLTFKPVISEGSRRLLANLSVSRAGSATRDRSSIGSEEKVISDPLVQSEKPKVIRSVSVGSKTQCDREGSLVKSSVITPRAAVALVGRLQSFKQEQELRRQEREKLHYSTDLRTNQPLFRPRVPMMPVQVLNRGHDRAQSAPTARTHTQLLEQMNAREVARIRRLELLSAAKRREEDRVCAPVVTPQGSKAIIQQANEHNMRETFRLLLASVEYFKQVSIIKTPPPAAERNRMICALAAEQPDWDKRLLDLCQVRPELMVPDLRDTLIEIKKEYTVESIQDSEAQRDLQGSPLTVGSVGDCDASLLSSIDPPYCPLSAEIHDLNTSLTMTDASTGPHSPDVMSPNRDAQKNPVNSKSLAIESFSDLNMSKWSSPSDHMHKCDTQRKEGRLVSYPEFRSLILKGLRKKSTGRSYLVAPRKRPQLAEQAIEQTHRPRMNPVSEKLMRYHLRVRDPIARSVDGASADGSNTNTSIDARSLSTSRDRSHRSSTTPGSRSCTPVPPLPRYESPISTSTPVPRPLSVDRARPGLFPAAQRIDSQSSMRLRAPSLSSTPSLVSSNTCFRPLFRSASPSPRSALSGSIASAPRRSAAKNMSHFRKRSPRIGTDEAAHINSSNHSNELFSSSVSETPLKSRSVSRSSLNLVSHHDASDHKSEPSSYTRLRSRSVGSASPLPLHVRNRSPTSGCDLVSKLETTVGYGLGFIPFWRSQHYDSFRQRVRLQSLTKQLAQLQSVHSVSASIGRDQIAGVNLPPLPCETSAAGIYPVDSAPPLPSELSSVPSTSSTSLGISSGNLFEETKVLNNFLVYLKQQQLEVPKAAVESEYAAPSLSIDVAQVAIDTANGQVVAVLNDDASPSDCAGVADDECVVAETDIQDDTFIGSPS